MNAIKNSYGSHRAYLTHLRTCLAGSLGRYTQARRIDWTRVTQLVFVCKGNVCRSPYAEVRATNAGLTARSFGLDTVSGTPANTSAARVAAHRGVDLASHRSTLFDPLELEKHDLAFAFEPDHYWRLLLASAGRFQVTLMGLWATSLRRPYIADPFGKCDAYFDSCFDVIDQSFEQILPLMSMQQGAR